MFILALICAIHFDQNAFIDSEGETCHMVLRNDAVPRLFMPKIKTCQLENFDDGTESLFGNQNLVSKEKQVNDRHKANLEMLESKIKTLSVHPKKHLQLRFAPKPHYIQSKRRVKTVASKQFKFNQGLLSLRERMRMKELSDELKYNPVLVSLREKISKIQREQRNLKQTSDTQYMEQESSLVSGQL